MLIREATINDSKSISRLVSALAEKFIVSDFAAEGREHLLASMTPTKIAKYIGSGYRYHVAENGEGLAGVVGIKDNNHLYHLFVAESHQGCGLAKTLWKKATVDSLARGNPREFTVNSSRYARPVYERLGFVAQSGPITKNGVTSTPMRFEVAVANKSLNSDAGIAGAG